jgi:hypothetical protein
VQYVIATILAKLAAREMEVRPSEAALQGGGFKPPQAAVVKGHGGERCGKGSARRNQVSVKETNTSEPLITCRKRRDVVKTRRESLTWEESEGNLLIAQMATGMKAA